MSGVIVNEVRRGSYVDSVALMRLSRAIAAIDGVQEAAVMMGTPANLEIMADADLLDERGRSALGGDLVIAIRADAAAAGDAALAAALAMLAETGRSTGAEASWRPSSLRAAAAAAPDANLALISVPGDFAAAEARKAIRRGLHAMIFSDNVSLADEVALKREAKELGVLVMGPDCGTAIVNGTPLAFANAVGRGDIGIIGASGTGIQEVSCLIDRLGGGVSHAIGVGGRDLGREVGAITTLMALDLLEDDPDTKQIVLISKPPPQESAAKVLDRVARSGKDMTVCLIGAAQLEMPDNAKQVATLEGAALSVMGGDDAAMSAVGAPAIVPAAGKHRVCGLYSGGTLCGEAQAIFTAAGIAVQSNAPVPGADAVSTASDAHALLDLGADEFTKGKPHPMIDPSVRTPHLSTALVDERTAVVLLDVVIGYGAHADPAASVVAALNDVPAANRPAVIASVTGTDADPQNRSAQVAALQRAGVHVAPSNAQAARWALAVTGTNA